MLFRSIYSTFLQRAYDQIIHDVCIQNLPVIFAIDRGGIVGEDGATHQGIFDLSFLSHIPNMSVMAPKNYAELKYMLEFAVNYPGPIAIRYPRGHEGKYVAMLDTPTIQYGKSEILQEGKTVALVAVGKMVEVALKAAKELKKKGLQPYVINARFTKPLDEETLASIAENIAHIFTLEDNMVCGGFGENLATKLRKNKEFQPIQIHNLGYPDEFIEHGSVDHIYKKYGLDSKSIAETIYQKTQANQLEVAQNG